jgi:hypothetical protein
MMWGVLLGVVVDMMRFFSSSPLLQFSGEERFLVGGL